MKFTQYKSPRLNGQKVWRIDVTIGGLRIRRGGFPTKEKAQQAIAALRIRAMSQQYGLPDESHVTVQDVIKERSQIPRYKDLDENHWIFKRFLKAVPGKTPVENLTKAHLRAFVTSCEKEGLEPTTINVYLAKVMACLNSATESFPELEDWTPPRIKKLKEGPGRERVLTIDEITRLLAVLRADRFKGERPAGARIRHEVHDIMRLVLLTGAREGEIPNLRKTAINHDFRTIQITSHKGMNGLTRTLPLSNLAIEILRSRETDRSRFFSINIHQSKSWADAFK